MSEINLVLLVENSETIQADSLVCVGRAKKKETVRSSRFFI
jgi:hypothetical protein